MTEKKKAPRHPRDFLLKAERAGRGMRLSVGGIVAVAELSEEKIMLVTHSGRVEVAGDGLLLSVFEGRCVEICGRILEVRFAYGKA